MEEKTNEIISWIKEKVKEANAKGVIVGLSGGIDSSCVAVLCKKAFPENMLGVIIPCLSDSDDLKHAKLLANKFDISNKVVELDEPFKIFYKKIEGKEFGGYEKNTAISNIKPRLRMCALYYLANKFNYLVVGTDNKTESMIGYFTKYGDGGVDILPISDLFKKDVRKLATYLEVPEEIIKKKPSAGLWKGQTDEDEMGISYEELDKILEKIEKNEDLSGFDIQKTIKVKKMIKVNEHKGKVPPKCKLKSNHIYEAPEFPKRIEIEISSACNLSCTYCPRHYIDNLKGYMDFDLFKKIISEIEKYPDTIIVLHRRGESLLHPRFKDMLGLVAGKFKEVQLATNATLLTPDKYEAIINGITFISFSIDTPNEFNKTRIPAKYEEVEQNILNFLKYNNGRVKTQVSMVKTNKTSPENCELFKKIWEGKVDRIRIYEEHSIGGIFGKINNPRKEREPCAMPIYELLIYDNGTIGRCNHDWDSERMGDVKTQTIKEVWNSEKYADLRKQHAELKFSEGVCKSCDSWYPKIDVQGTGEVIEKQKEEFISS